MVHASTNVGLDDFEKVFELLQNVKPSLVKETLTESVGGLVEKSASVVDEENKDTVKFNLFCSNVGIPYIGHCGSNI